MHVYSNHAVFCSLFVLIDSGERTESQAAFEKDAGAFVPQRHYFQPAKASAFPSSFRSGGTQTESGELKKRSALYGRNKSRSDSTIQPCRATRRSMKKHTIWLGVGFLVTLVLIVFWVMLDNACTLSAANPKEPLLTCYRAWIGALSGWVAALVGIGAIVAAYTTIRAMQNQSLMALGQYKDKELVQKENQYTEQLQSLANAINVMKRAVEHIGKIDPKTASTEEVILNAKQFDVALLQNLKYLNDDPDIPFRARLHVDFVRNAIDFVIRGMERKYATRTDIRSENWTNTADLLDTTIKMLEAEQKFATEALNVVTDMRKDLNSELAKISGIQRDN